MDRGIVAMRYARALYAFATKHGVDRAVYEYCDSVYLNTLRFPARMRRVLANYTIEPEKKEEILITAARGSVNEQFRRFVKLVVANRREYTMPEICKDYVEMFRAKNHILDVEIVTAVPMSEQTEAHLAEFLEKETGEVISIEKKVDPSIKGGYVLRLGTYRIDASVAARLKRVQEGLMSTNN